MMPGNDNQRRVLLRGLLVMLVVSSAVLPIGTLRDGSVSQWYEEIRQLKTQRLFSARALDVLKDNPDVINSVRDSATTPTALRVSLVESVKRSVTAMDAELTELSVTDARSELAAGGVDQTQLHTLRIEFVSVLNRATDLLYLLDAVREVADWRTLEVRGCTVSRLSEKVAVSASCSIDLYYFPELDT